MAFFCVRRKELKIMLNKCGSFVERCIKYIAVIPLLLLTVLTFLFRNSIAFDSSEFCTINRNGIKFFVVLAVAVVLLWGFYNLLKWIPEKVLFVVLAGMYLIVGCYMITHIQMLLRHDSAICYWNAFYFAKGTFLNLQQGEYFYMCPHQLGLASYNCLLFQFSDKENFVYFVNLFWILLTNFCLWRTMVLLYEERAQLRKLIIVLSFVFLPQFFFLFYAYGQVPGLGCLAVAVYLTVRAIKKKCMWSMIFSLVFIAGACIVRTNYLIGGIALIIVYLLHSLKEKRTWGVICASCILCAMLLPKQAINSYYEKAAGTDLSNGIPATLYVAMGLQERAEDWRAAAGWFNGYNQEIYLNSGCDVEVSGQIAMDMIRERFQTFIEYPHYAVDFFGEKLISTWCEPTFQSVWVGPLVSLGSTTDVEWLGDLYSGGAVFGLLASLMNVLNVILFSFALLFVLWKIIRGKEILTTIEWFGILFFVGGFTFHFFWETASQYVYPYVVFLIPVAARGMDVAFAFVHEKVFFKFREKNKLEIDKCYKM